MNQAERDAERWMQNHAKWQQREIYRAKETGDAYYINEYGDVIVKNHEHKAKNPGESK